MHVWEVRAHTDCGIPVEVRGQLEVGGVTFSFQPCGSWGLNVGYQAWW